MSANCGTRRRVTPGGEARILAQLVHCPTPLPAFHTFHFVGKPPRRTFATQLRPPLMNLIVDIGNSTTKAAVFDGGRMLAHTRFETGLADALHALLEGRTAQACAYSIVGAEYNGLEDTLRLFAPRLLRVTGETPTPLRNDYRTPATLGADRLAAAVGAAALEPGRDIMVADAGTCVTYDYVSADGRYLGGNISPGLGMRLRALHEHTARLPLVAAEGETPACGYDTETAVRSGVVDGMRLEIEGCVRRFLDTHAGGVVFATGGNGTRFASPRVRHHKALVETGLDTILRHNMAAR